MRLKSHFSILTGSEMKNVKKSNLRNKFNPDLFELMIQFSKNLSKKTCAV